MKTKMLNWLVALLLCAVIGWALVTFKPRTTMQTNTPHYSVTTPLRSIQTAQSPLKTLPRMSVPPSAQGSVLVSPQEYLNTLESLYRKRGYKQVDLQQVLIPNRKRWRQARGVFWRESNLIVGAGINANPHINQSRTQAVYMTVAQAVPNGASWATYEKPLNNDLPDLTEAAVLDLTGTDPPGIPRLPGAQRIMSVSSGANMLAVYTSVSPLAEVLGFYEEHFRQLDWVLDPVTTAMLRDATPDVVCFVTQGRVCLVWLQREREVGTTTILISVDGI